MAIRLTLLCAGATALSRTAAFAHPDAPLDAGGAAKAAALSPRASPGRIVSSPHRAAIETVAALGVTAEIAPLLADMDFGAWSGRRFAELDDAELAQWLADPTGATPGGETLNAVAARVGGWMDACVSADGPILAVSHAAVLRAAIAHALSVPVAATLQIDIAPLMLLDLSHHGRWRVQELRRPRGSDAAPICPPQSEPPN